MKKKLMTLAALLCVGVLAFAGCGGGGGGDTASEDPLADGVLKVALEDTYLPYEFRDEQDNLVGFDIDFTNALAEELGVEVEFVATSFDGIFNGLNAKQYDAVISATSITPERLEGFSMSEPYVTNGIVIVSRKDATPVKTFEELDGKSVAVQLSTTSDEAAESLKASSGKNVDIKKYDGMLDAFTALKAKQVDNVMTDIGVAQYYVDQDPDVYTVTSEVLTNEPIGITARKDDTEFINKLNETLKKLQDNGKMKEISEKWFGKDMTTDIDAEVKTID